jgi:formylglycine-generating enzyme required for sulfatase activity
MRAAWPLLLALAAGCSQVVDLANLSGGAGGAPLVGGSGGAGGAVSGVGGVVGTGVGGAAGVAAADGGGGADAAGAGGGQACPDARGGPTLVRAGSFCIDATEVTNAQYQEFLDAKKGDFGGQPTVCAWNRVLTPDAHAVGWPAVGRENHPVVNVDWCDAVAFCAWAGKRLCGRIDGGSLEISAVGDPQRSQRASACSRAGTRSFAYGGAYESGVCSDGKPESAESVVRVRASERCQGGYDGIYDLSGNVEEWVDACEGEAGEDDLCRIAGGSAAGSGGELSCASHYADPRNDKYFMRGFRCCSK